MLILVVPATNGQLFNDATQEFLSTKEAVLQLEHSLVSVSKWESKWKKPFLNSDKTIEESLDYIKCMTINHNVDDTVYRVMTNDLMQQVMDYISDSMTATTITKDLADRQSREVITAEIIYYWMIAQNVPFECRKWHLNKLLTLIRVCAIKNAPPKKMKRGEIMSRNKALNAARRAQLGTSG